MKNIKKGFLFVIMFSMAVFAYSQEYNPESDFAVYSQEYNPESDFAV